MAALEVPDQLWARIAEVLPARQRRHRWPGRKPLDDRACPNRILFVLLTGINWGDLPQQLGYGSGMTCWRRLRDWQAAGVWGRLHALPLAELHALVGWTRRSIRPWRGGRGTVRRDRSGARSAHWSVSR